MYTAVSQMLKTVKDKTGHILENYPETRNSDKVLTRKYRQVFDWLDQVMDLTTYCKLTSAETIGRCRREFQEHGEHLANEKVQEERELRESVHRSEFGGNAGTFWK